MTQKLTILFDLDGTLVDTAPDLLAAHNHVMKKFGYNTKNIDEINTLRLIRNAIKNKVIEEVKKIYFLMLKYCPTQV